MLRHVIAAAFLAGAVQGQAQTPPPSSSVRPGDDQLSCAQLAAESVQLQAELDGMSTEIAAAAQQQIQAARSAQAASTASSLASSIPIIGGIIGQVGSMAAGAAVNAQQDRMLSLSERMIVRGTEIGQRMSRVEILRSARCGTGAGTPPPAQPQTAEPAAGRD